MPVKIILIILTFSLISCKEKREEADCWDGMKEYLKFAEWKFNVSDFDGLKTECKSIADFRKLKIDTIISENKLIAFDYKADTINGIWDTDFYIGCLFQTNGEDSIYIQRIEGDKNQLYSINKFKLNPNKNTGIILIEYVQKKFHGTEDKFFFDMYSIDGKKVYAYMMISGFCLRSGKENGEKDFFDKIHFQAESLGFDYDRVSYYPNDTSWKSMNDEDLNLTIEILNKLKESVNCEIKNLP